MPNMTGELHKLQQVFTLIRLLNTSPAKSAKQLMGLLGIQKSQFYRYKKLLEKVGYTIDTNAQHRMSLKFIDPEAHKKGLSKDELGQDELGYLHDLLQAQVSNSPHAETLLHKFDRHLSLAPLADALPQLHRSKMIQLIRSSINLNRQLKIIGYRSLTGNKTSDRHVEPLDLTPDQRYLIAWDLDKDDQRQFKLERITDVDVLDAPITPGRMATPMDIFGLTGERWHNIKLKLGRNAHHLMIEEFPLSRAFIRKRGDDVFFEGQVLHFKGIGRFTLGFIDEIEIVAPQEFKDYLKEKLKNFDHSLDMNINSPTLTK